MIGAALACRSGVLRLGAAMRLEDLLTHPDGFGLTTATPVQRAFCRAADGLPLGSLSTHQDVITAIGTTDLPPTRPLRIGLFSGVRTGKSLTAAALALRATQTIDVSRLSPGDLPRVSVISISTDKAHAVYEHIVGTIRERPVLRNLCVDDPRADSLLMRHPSGRPVEIKVVAGARAGGAVVSRWSAGVILDECPRMVGEEDGVVNMDEVVRGSIPRLLPGAQLVMLGSPWAPWGPAYQVVQEHFGKPSASVVIFWCGAQLLNPVWWTPERCEDIRRTDPVAYTTDVEARFHESVASNALPPDLVDSCAEHDVLEPEAGMHYVAAIDPATRGNAWALVIGHRDRMGRVVIDLCREWQGSGRTPLSPRATLAEIAAACRPYGQTTIHGDQWSIDANRDIASEYGLGIAEHMVSAVDKVDAVKSLLGWLVDRAVVLPKGVLCADLKRLKRKVTQQGATIDLPKTPDGRHCDSAAALLVLLRAGLQDPEPEMAVKPGDPSYHAWRMEQDEINEFEREQRNARFEL
jgi:hypothetical protein